MLCTPRAMCVGSFSAAFAKCLWPLVCVSCHGRNADAVCDVNRAVISITAAYS